MRVKAACTHAKNPIGRAYRFLHTVPIVVVREEIVEDCANEAAFLRRRCVVPVVQNQNRTWGIVKVLAAAFTHGNRMGAVSISWSDMTSSAWACHAWQLPALARDDKVGTRTRDLQAVYPAVTYSVGELLLLTPQDLRGKPRRLATSRFPSGDTVDAASGARRETLTSGWSKAARRSHFSRNWVSAPALRSLNSGSMDMTVSMTDLSRNGTRTSRPCAMVALLARRQSKV